MKRPVAAVVLCVAILCVPESVAAQSTDERDVEITFDTGDFDADAGDWPITVVYVSGDVDEAAPFTVELLGEDGGVLWTGTEDFDGPTTAVAVASFVAVGDVVQAAISQPDPEVAGDVTERDVVDVLRQGAGGSGGGTIALSLVLAIILLAILFRTPLPSAVTQRWTK